MQRPRRTSEPIVERLEGRSVPTVLSPGDLAQAQLTADDVQSILDRATEATSSRDAIIAIVDRNGNLLGVRAEDGVDPAIFASPEAESFAVDGAMAKARTGAFFANNEAPLTSRTIQMISQTTMTQREIQSNPNVLDPNSTVRGPGFVAPIGIKNHFPPGIQFTPQVDLFAIEHTNRDSIVHPGPDHVKGTADDISLPNRFNVPSQYIPDGVELPPPESYGYLSGIDKNAQSRGIATLPGGLPIFKNGKLVGGIGVFFPGKTGYATEENSNLNDAGFYDPAKPDRSREAEFIAFSAVGGSRKAGLPIGPAPFGKTFTLPFGRIDLVGITLDVIGAHGLQGPKNVILFGRGLRKGTVNGTDLPINENGETLAAGQPVPQGWLVTPHDGNWITAQEVIDMVQRGIKEANRVRAAIRLPLDRTAKMVFAVSDRDGNILGIYRMKDATYFSIDVAVAKARNVMYYADPAQLQPQDRISNVPAGTAFTNRTFRYVALPRFPEGIDGYPPGPFSILTDGGVQPNGRNDGPPLPASAYQSAQGYDAFNPGTNFHDPYNVANQNGVVFFPGSTPVYKPSGNGDGKVLSGGLGVSGDGVDQDDDVTYEAGKGFFPGPNVRRADQTIVRGVRLPFIKFNRQPHEPVDESAQPESSALPLPVPPPRAKKR